MINGALPGANTSDQYHHFLELKNAIRPDFVLVGMYLNDAQESQSFYAKNLKYPFSQSRFLSFINSRLQILKLDALFLKIRPGQIDPEWRERFRNGRVLATGDMFKTRTGFDYEIYNAHKDFGLGWNNEAWENLSNVTASLSKAVEQSQADMALALYPVHIQVFADDSVLSNFPQNEFLKMCSNLSLPCLDLLPALRAAAAEGMTKEEMYYDHCHLKDPGNQVVANTIKKWLIDAQLLNL